MMNGLLQGAVKPGFCYLCGENPHRTHNEPTSSSPYHPSEPSTPPSVPQSNGKVNYTVSGDNALGLSSAERSSPAIPKKNPTRSSLKARVKSYLFHLYWNEAGPFNKTDVAVISSDSTTRANDALLLCYLNTERVLGLCELRPVWLFRRETVDSRFAGALPEDAGTAAFLF